MVVPFLYSIRGMRADDPGRRTGGSTANAINPLNAMPNPRAMPRSHAFPHFYDREDEAAARRVTWGRKIFRRLA